MKKLGALVVIFALFFIGVILAGGSAVKEETGLDMGLTDEVFGIIKDKAYDKNHLNLRKMAEEMANGMLHSVDPFSRYIRENGSNEFLAVGSEPDFSNTLLNLGFCVEKEGHRMIVSGVKVGSPAHDAGLKENDIVLTLNGESAESDVATCSFGEKHLPISVRVKRGGKVMEVKIFQAPAPAVCAEVSFKNYAGKEIAVLKISNFGASSLENIRSAIAQIKKRENRPYALVIDLRKNPGGYVEKVIDCMGELLTGEVLVESIEDSDGNMVKRQVVGAKEDPFGGIPRICLIDEYVASAGEVAAACLRDVGGVKLLGEKTYGKGSVQSYFKLKNGGSMYLTTGHWYTPKGVCVQGVGLMPDIEIIRTNRDEIDGRDPQMDKALEILAGR